MSPVWLAWERRQLVWNKWVKKRKKRKTKGDQVIRVEHGKRALISQPSGQEKSLLHPFGYRHTSSMGGRRRRRRRNKRPDLVGANMSGLLLDEALISHPLFLALPQLRMRDSFLYRKQNVTPKSGRGSTESQDFSSLSFWRCLWESCTHINISIGKTTTVQSVGWPPSSSSQWLCIAGARHLYRVEIIFVRGVIYTYVDRISINMAI